MALYKSNHETKYGIEANYWKITQITLNAHYGWCDITVSGYASEEARRMDKEPLDKETVRANWNPNEFGSFFSASSFTENPKEVKDSRPFMQNLKCTLTAEEKPAFNQNIYERAYEYVKRDERFKDAKDLI